MEIKKSTTAITTIETVERYTLTTEDIEYLINEKYNFSGRVCFNWKISQWVYLEVVVRNTTRAEHPKQEAGK